MPDNCGVRVSIQQHVSNGIHFALAKIPAAANVADDVFDFEGVVIKQREIAYTRHDKLKGDLAASGPAPSNQNTCVLQRAYVEQGGQPRKCAIVIHAALLRASAICPWLAKRRSGRATDERV